MLRAPRRVSLTLLGSIVPEIVAIPLWAAGLVLATAVPAQGPPTPPVAVQLTIDTARPRATFDPAVAFGAGLDGHEEGENARIYTPSRLAAMRSAGLGCLSYRLRTELGVEAWHWNPSGRWSDPVHHRGYWTSDSTLGEPITTSYGYRLPRRGNTIDQASNDGYSRLDDGNLNSYWKSNPYLDSYYTHDSGHDHDQWVVIDFGDPQTIDSALLWWGTPYATHYRWQYWRGDQSFGYNPDGRWINFPGGSVAAGTGGNIALRLTRTPVQARFVRLILEQSSHTALPGSSDMRDRLGYALRELGVGYHDAKGQFHDLIRHAALNTQQTLIYTSSCDPWHRATDRDHKTEQPGFDLVAASGLGAGQPLLVPVGTLYDTPADAAAELRYLEARHYALRGVEMGEEPDGQVASSADYAELYLQDARALRNVDARVPLGGPSFQSVDVDDFEWPVAPQAKNWLGRVLDYLTVHGHRADFQFCSFEWYPFDNICADTAPLLHDTDHRMDRAMDRFRAAGLPANFPYLITEFGYSAYAAQAEVDLPGMLFNADSTVHFLSVGGSTAYLYGYEPATLIQEVPCPEPGAARAWGNNALFLADDDGAIQYRTAAYYGAWLTTHQWAMPTGGTHTLYAATAGGLVHHYVLAYPIHRPDGQWAVMLLNENPNQSALVTLAGKPTHLLTGPVEVYTYGPDQYVWHPHRDQGFPNPDGTPAHASYAKAPTAYLLPPYSLTVVRGPSEQSR